jgi:flagellar hook-basal body complex protein FliE
MSTPFNAATAAYGSAAKLISERSGGLGVPSANTQPSGADFSQLLAQQLTSTTEVGRVSDQASMAMVNGQANVVDVVTALSQTEMAMETMVTVRDRVISAYEEIMRMPI